MAKYDWKQLEKEYISGNYKSINAFLKEKGISRNKTTNTQTKEWNIKKHQKDIKKTSKTIEKVIEKSRRPSGLRKTTRRNNSLAHRTTWLRSDFGSHRAV